MERDAASRQRGFHAEYARVGHRVFIHIRVVVSACILLLFMRAQEQRDEFYDDDDVASYSDDETQMHDPIRAGKGRTGPYGTGW